MTRIRFLLVATVLGVAAYGCSPPQANQAHDNTDILFQTSTIRALLEGVYDGDMTYREVMEHGDFGLGTFNHLDGEMVAVDGKVYQIRADGKASTAPDSMKTPFAVVTFFEPDRTVHVQESIDCTQLQEQLDTVLPTKNILYAIRVEGAFEYIKARSVPAQKKPYPRLAKVIENEVAFEFSNTQGTMVGFRLPTYMADINVGGYHFHFLNADRSAGGHVLTCRVRDVTVEIDDTSEFLMALPDRGDFYTVNLR
ncbi:MAG: acetolactate decarboxylase [Candidatus Methylomirabilales bacterium]